jgi:hypothetical protein
MQIQPFPVRKFLHLGRSFHIAYVGIRERHVGISFLVEKAGKTAQIYQQEYQNFCRMPTDFVGL